MGFYIRSRRQETEVPALRGRNMLIEMVWEQREKGERSDKWAYCHLSSTSPDSPLN
jgi:hypothetical protein